MTKTMHDKIEIHPDDSAHAALLKMTANATLDKAAQLDRSRTHSPEFHEDGWKIAIETPHGILGLWSCWLGNRFHLGYPGPEVCPLTAAQVDVLIEEHLEVKRAEPVPSVNVTAVEPHYTGEYKDPDKPLGVNTLGQTLAYQARGTRQWATHWGPRVSQGLGRIWIDHSNFSSEATDFHFLVPGASEVLQTAWYGHDNGWNIYTYPHTFANHYAPDSPTADPAHVQPYRDRFLSLACALAENLGGPSAVNIDYGFVVTPAQLKTLGYTNLHWIKGSPDDYRGWGNELIFAQRKLSGDRAEHLLLRSGNALVPWAAIRRVPIDAAARALTPQSLLGLLTF